MLWPPFMECFSIRFNDWEGSSVGSLIEPLLADIACISSSIYLSTPIPGDIFPPELYLGENWRWWCFYPKICCEVWDTFFGSCSSPVGAPSWYARYFLRDLISSFDTLTSPFTGLGLSELSAFISFSIILSSYSLSPMLPFKLSWSWISRIDWRWCPVLCY